jgi:hypothetical protein
MRVIWQLSLTRHHSLPTPIVPLVWSSHMFGSVGLLGFPRQRAGYYSTATGEKTQLWKGFLIYELATRSRSSGGCFVCGRNLEYGGLSLEQGCWPSVFTMSYFRSSSHTHVRQ